MAAPRIVAPENAAPGAPPLDEGAFAALMQPLGPFEPAQRFWHGSAPQRDIVARSVDGSRVLVGEARRSLDPKNAGRLLAALAHASLPGASDCDIVPVLFVPEAEGVPRQNELGFVVDAETVFSALR